jgi:hypothetical protein
MPNLSLSARYALPLGKDAWAASTVDSGISWLYSGINMALLLAAEFPDNYS